MPITPNEAAEKNLKKMDVELKKAFERIDQKLVESFIGNNVVTISLPYVHARVKKEIEAVYRNKGWDVEIKSFNDRNEMAYTAKFSRSKIDQKYVEDWGK